MALDGDIGIIKSLAIPNTGSIVSAAPALINAPPGFCNDYVLNILADQTGTSSQNDVSTVLWYFGSTTTAATLILYKWNGTSWVNQAAIDDNDYGTFSSFGTFVNKENQSFIYFQANWALIQAAFGNGFFKVTVSYTDSILGNGTIDSYTFNLQLYSAARADGSIRLEYWLSGITEDITNDTLIKDYSDKTAGAFTIYNNLRVKGWFGFPKSTYKSDTIEYDNGQEIWVEDRREPIYQCQIKMTQEFVHKIIRTDFMMADQLAITDYNSRNAEKYITKYVIKDSEYSPEYYPLLNISSPVLLKFKPQFNRSRKFRI